MVLPRCRFLAPALVLLIGAPAFAAEAVVGDAPAVTAQDLAERAVVDALLVRAEAQGLPTMAGGMLLDGVIERTSQHGNSRMTTQDRHLALRDAAGKLWIGAAEPLPDEPGVSATWQPRASGASVNTAFPAPYFAAIAVARLAQGGSGTAWAVLGSFAVRPSDAQPSQFPLGPDTAAIRTYLHADEAVPLSRPDALAHALVLWGLRRLCDLPLDRLADMEAFIVATAPPRLAAWAANEAAERRRARTTPEPVAPFAVGADGEASPSVSDAQLVEALADSRSRVVPAQGFDGIGTIGTRVIIADIASSALAHRWRLVPEIYAHLPIVVGYAHLGPSMAPRPDAARFIAVLRERVLDPAAPLADRLGAALAGAPTEDLLAVLPEFDPRAIHYDPLAPHLSLLRDRGSESSPAEAADQVPIADLRQALARNLAPIWTRARPALTTQQLAMVVQCLGDEPALAPVLDAWPWTAADESAHAAYDEQHGRSERTDALVLAGLIAERLAPPMRDDPLLRWRPRPTAARLELLQRLLTDPATAEARCLWLNAVISNPRPRGREALPAADLGLLLVALLLADERAIPTEPAAAVARFLAADPDAAGRMGQAYLPFSAGLPAGTRVCDLALHQARWWLQFGLRAAEVSAALGTGDSLYDLRMPPERRDAVRLVVRRALVPIVRQAAERLAWSAPVELTALPAEVPLLSADEDAALRAVLAEAVALGFPDLAGSTVRSGALPGQEAEQRIHVRLADGRWLVGGDGPPSSVAADLGEAVLPEPATDPVYGPSGDVVRRLAPLASRLPRIGAWRMALLHRRGEAWPSLAILARWAAAPRSAGLDAAMLAMLCVHAENPELWPAGTCDLDFGLSPSNPPPVGQSVADLLRERLSRWFLDRAAAGDRRDAPGAARFAEAALAILPPADRAYWAGPVSRAAGRAAIPAAEAPTAELARRLAAWQSDRWQRFGGPRVADDDGALVALLGDLSPVRAERGGLPLTVGQVALFTLADRWHGDPRWVVGRPDDTLGTDEALRADASAIKEWWRIHGAEGEAARAAALMAGASPAGIASREVYSGFPHTAAPAIGAALTARFAAGMPDENAAVRPSLALPALLWFAPAIGTSGWPDDAVHRQVRRLLALASGNEGAAAALLDATELVDPDPRSGPNAWQLEGFLQPQRNLGLIVHQPTREHRALLRAARGTDLAQPVAGLLAALAGGRGYPVLGDHSPSHAWWGRSPTSGALAIDLVAEALKDPRPIPASLRGSLKPWARNTTNYDLPDPEGCPGLRVCDWAMARVLVRPQDLDVQPPVGMPSAEAYLAKPLAERDALLPAMREEVNGALKAAAQAAGLEAAPPSSF